MIPNVDYRRLRMKKILILFVVLITLFIMHRSDVNATEAEEYTIQKGDTLWDISDSKLDDYFLWPKLWNVNPDIENPDLIYPGNTIIIPSREELMKMPSPAVKRKPFTYKPKTRKQEAKHIFVHRKKLGTNYIVDRNLFIKSGWISDEFPSVGEITYSPMNRNMIGKGDTVYIELFDRETLGQNTPSLIVTEKQKPDAPQKFYAIRDIKIVTHPVTEEVIGHQIRVLGILKVIGKNDNVIKAKITHSFEEVHTGDGLLPYTEMEPPLIPESARTPDINGYIIESHLNSYLLGEGDIIFLDKGEKDGLEVGDVFSVFSNSPVKRPLGKIQILSLRSSTSNAVILKGVQEMTVGSRWGKQ